jgi:endonuclease/exonuclease/phosphatase family metal-dependent hydrolase
VVGLQEAVLEPEGFDGTSLESLATATGREVISGQTFASGNGYFGNLLLVAGKVSRTDRLDLSVGSREPRCAIDVTLECSGLPVRVIVTHLGLSSFERKHQVRTLLESVADSRDEFVILMGDFNLWYPASAALRKVAVRFGKVPGLRTYPSRFPLFHLDRIWVHPKGALQFLEVHKTRASAVASDHLPIKGLIQFSQG